MSIALPSQDHLIRIQRDLKRAPTGNLITNPAYSSSLEWPLEAESNVPRVSNHGEEI